MTHHKTMCAPAETSIGDQGDDFPNPAPIMAEVGFSISGMPGAPFGPTYRDDDYIAGFYLAGLMPAINFCSPSKTRGRAFEFFTFLPTDFRHTASFGQIAIKDLQMAGFFNGLFERIDDFLCFKIEVRY